MAIRTNDEVGEDLCEYCELTEYGCRKINTGPWNLCEGIGCDKAYEEYLEGLTIMKCTKCLEDFDADELIGYNVNGEVVSTTDLETHIQNPDYCVEILCGECDHHE